jgi:hypothetical protein
MKHKITEPSNLSFIASRGNNIKFDTFSFNLREIKVYMGVHNRLNMDRTTTIIRKIEKAAVHPKFDIFTFDNDIAVLHLNEEVEFTRIIKPACLPTQGNCCIV